MRRQNSVVLYGLADDARDDRSEDSELGSIARTAAEVLHVPYAGIHIVDRDDQITLASSNAREQPVLPRSESLCSLVLARTDGADVFEMSDASVEPLFRDLPSVGVERDSIRFYAAAP